MNSTKVLLSVFLWVTGVHTLWSAEYLRYHTLVLDGQGEVMPWSTPATNAFDNYLVKCWSYALAAPNDAHGLPISFLYCAWNPGNPPTADTSWENDVGEKIPRWVESARLYYQYRGDLTPLNYVKRLVDYSLVHGQTPTNHVWPDFPVGTANAGDTEFRGFTGRWSLWDCHVDLAADIGFSMYRMYQVYGDTKYRDKAIHVADVLADHIVAGTATDSPWPYVISSQTGANQSRYAASWDGALELFDLLIAGNQGSVSDYSNARATLKAWLLTYPMQNGNWVDGHSDVKINGTGNWSATCASDMCLYLFEHPEWDPNFLSDVPKLLKWVEDNFVNVSTPDGLSGQYYGAYVPAEQTAYMYRMGYQAARLGAQYARWYEVTGDGTYKDRAYRCLSYNTYMMQTNGQSSDGPTESVGYWWSDCYGEAPMMYYYALGAVPEWAPPGENHLLRSSSVVTSIMYSNDLINYTTFDDDSTETLRLGFTPGEVLVNGVLLLQRADLSQAGWVFSASNGVLHIRHDTGTSVQILASLPAEQPPTITTVLLPTGFVSMPYSANLTANGGTPPYVWSVAGGGLPPGLTLNSGGDIIGVPTITGTFNFTAQVGDAGDPVQTATKSLSVTVVGTLISIAVTPVNPSVMTGSTQQFSANGTYSDGSVQDLTSQATWTSSNPAVATVNASGLASAALAGNTTISAGMDGVSGSSTLTVQPPPVTITTTSLPNGTVGTVYTATVMASGGSLPYDWSMAVGSLPADLSLNPVSGVIAGTPSAAGTFDFTMQVNDSSDPAQAATKPLRITVVSFAGSIGNTNDGTSTDYIWSSGAWINACRFQAASNMTVATMFAKVGGIRGKYKCAIYNDISSRPSRLLGSTAEVSNPASVWQPFPLTSSVVLTNGNCYWLAIWSDDANARVCYSASNGTLRWGQYSYAMWPDPIVTSGGGSFNYCIYAKGATATATLTRITVTPANPSILAGGTQQFTATGTYSDGSTQNISSQATWNSSSLAVATVNAGGLATAVLAGSTTISTTLAGVTGSTALTVQPSPTLTSIAVSPANSIIELGSSQQFTATGTYSDGTSRNITSQVIWTSSMTSVATVNTAGLATCVSAGTATISAVLAGISGSTVLTVQPVPLSITTASLPNSTANVAYSAALEATGGIAPYGWSVASGSLPPGLTLNASSGAIAGTPTATGTFNFTAQVTDSGTPAQTATKSLSITVPSAGSIWTSTTVPGRVDGGTTRAAELGVKFSSEVAGTVTGIRFYKASANIGTHVGNLWTSNGSRLATMTFTGETASGWQQVDFATAAAISANTTYVASYHVNSGHYSADANYFSTAGVDNPPLHALPNSVTGGNGVYRNTSGSAFPNTSGKGTNYWVDVVFKPTVPASLTSIAITPGNLTVMVGATQQFTATGTYSDGSTQNVTSQASWSSTTTAVATINASALATAVSAGTATISATLSGVTGSTTLTVQAVPVAITTAALPAGTVSVGYSATLTASGGTLPYTWSLSSGALPAELTLKASNGAITGTPTTAGTLSFAAKVTDAGSPTQTATKALSITIASVPTAVSLWPSTAVPGVVDSGPDSAVELGVKFRSDVNGKIAGIRFYKAAANTGTHVGNLWSSTGTKLATATFSGETRSGWQQVNFSTPVAITSNTVYVASYHPQGGHYSCDQNYFSSRGVDKPPLHAPANGVSAGSGVYAYGSTSAFPTQTWNAANYWVDVVFAPGP